MKIVLLDTATLGYDLDLSPITSLGDAVEYENTDPDQIAERLQGANVAVLNKLKLNASNLSEAKDLKLICVAATGYDNIDTEYCRAHGIALCNVPGYSTDSVAQITLAMALSLASKLTEYNSFVHSGDYTASGVANKLTPVYHELSSMTWGIVGGGAIGSKVAHVAKAIGSHVLVCRRKPDDRYEQVDIDELCQRSDIISLHIPLTDETRGIISSDRIAKMKKCAVIINAARGAVTDEEALAEAILEGRIGGLAVDVYSTEPFGKDHPFNKIKDKSNVILTPHMAWGAAEARARCVKTIANNILCFIDQKRVNRIV